MASRRLHRPLIPKPSAINPQEGGETTPRKQPKSRNGCITCKSKRMKCDEKKPACYQCTRRGHACGGYNKDLKWKSFGKPKNVSAVSKQSEETTRQANHSIQAPHRPKRQHSVNNREDGPSDRGESVLTFLPAQRSNHGESTLTFLPVQHSELRRLTEEPCSQALLDDAIDSAITTINDIHVFAGSDNDLSDMSMSQSPPEEIPIYSISRSPRLTLDLLFPGTNKPLGSEKRRSPRLADIQPMRHPGISETPGWSDWYLYDPAVVVNALLGIEDESDCQSTQLGPCSDMSSDERTRLSRRDSAQSDEQDATPLYDQPEFPINNPDVIALLFDSHTCSVLSMKDYSTANPWRANIWPLAQDFPFLYHAIAAMTCLHLGKAQPRLRPHGLDHMRKSLKGLTVHLDDANPRFDVALAAVLSIGFAETWDHPRTSTGMGHIKNAKSLVQRALAKHLVSGLPADEMSLLSVLANTWIYMDVIARLTSETNTTTDFEFMATCGILSPSASDHQIDPLMGCASSLFPLIGRVADVVRRVRKRSTDRNSPAIVSQAAELKVAIERWTPSIDLESPKVTSPNISESVQTAEAYRWAALLLLRQAVPELPSMLSYLEMAQKVLIFLATIPITSYTVVVHTLPLIIAGVEVFEEEDRDWVRERWTAMTRRMFTGLADRCLEVTEEVWKRRDDFGKFCGPCQAFGVPFFSSTPSTTDPGFVLDPELADPHSNSNSDCQCGLRALVRASSSSDFPASAAFKKHADPLTRAGYMEYTPKGKLHWMGVMKDWGWEVMLG